MTSFDGVTNVFLDRRRELVAKDEGEHGDDFEKKNDANGPDEYLEENLVNLAQGPQAAAEADDEDESADDQEKIAGSVENVSLMFSQPLSNSA